jgi:hypothetical protein
LYLNPADHAQIQALLTGRNTPCKVVWRAEIVLATTDGCGIRAIVRRADTAKPTVMRGQARGLDDGVAGLRRDKARLKPHLVRGFKVSNEPMLQD